MSKYFNETKKAREWAPNEGVAQDTDLLGVLESVRRADEVAAEITEMRTGSAQKIQIPHRPGAPLIVGNGNSNGYSGDAAKRAMESYRALRTRLLRQVISQGLRSVVLTSAQAGEGKTVTALNLAQCCAQLHNQRVLLIDADLRTSGLSRLLGLPVGPGLSEVLSGHAEFKDAVRATDATNLYVVGAGDTGLSSGELFAESRWKKFMGWCGESFTLVLIDAPPILPLADFELISAECDAVLMVVLARKTNRARLQKASAQVDSKKLIGMVFNAIDHSRQDKNYYGQRA